MILPQWYRLARSLWVLPFVAALWFSSYTLLTLEHASPEVQANGNEQEVLIIARILGVMFLVGGVAALFAGRYLYNRLPYRMRQHNFEELRLGQAICKEVERLFNGSEKWYGDYDLGGYVLSWSAMDLEGSRLWNNLRFLFGSYFLHGVHVSRRQAGIMDDEGVEHCPTVLLIIEIPTGVTRYRDELIEKYRDGTPLFEKTGEFDEANWKFKKQMHMDRPSVEELQMFLHDLRSIPA